MMRGPWAWFCLLAFGNGHADTLPLCYHYGCKREARFEVAADDKQRLSRLLAGGATAEAEREAVRSAIQQLYLTAGKSTPIWQDKGGNFSDGGAEGRMDCVDHSSNVTTFLRYLQDQGWLRFHSVSKPAWRAPWIVNLHYTAVLHDSDSGQDWAVDSWFKDFGAQPEVVPLAIWKEGYSP